MKTIGKIAILAMTLALAAVLTACGGSGSGSAASSSSAASASAAASSASASSTSAASSATSSSAAAGDYVPGKVSGDTYENEFFGFTYKLPEGFKFQDEAYLKQMNQVALDMFDSEAVTQALESGAAFFEMAAIGSNNSSNINAVVAYAGTPEAKALDAKGYLQYTDATLADQLASTGAKVESTELGTYKSSVTGAEFPSLKIKLSMNGVTMNEEMVCLKAGDYFMTITATSADEPELDQILCNLALAK